MNFIVQHGTVGASFDLSQWGVGARTALLKISIYCMSEECTVGSFLPPSQFTPHLRLQSVCNAKFDVQNIPTPQAVKYDSLQKEIKQYNMEQSSCSEQLTGDKKKRQRPREESMPAKSARQGQAHIHHSANQIIQSTVWFDSEPQRWKRGETLWGCDEGWVFFPEANKCLMKQGWAT